MLMVMMVMMLMLMMIRECTLYRSADAAYDGDGGYGDNDKHFVLTIL